ncbi:MAG: hypothetical protein AAB472_00235 [Patescibacteria group bacterium]
MQAPIIAAIVGGLFALFVTLFGHAYLTFLQLKKEKHLSLTLERRRIYSELCASLMISSFDMITTDEEGPENTRFQRHAWVAANTKQLSDLQAKINAASFYASDCLRKEFAFLSEFLHVLIIGGSYSRGTKGDTSDEFLEKHLYIEHDKTMEDIFQEPWQRALKLMKKEVGLID